MLKEELGKRDRQIDEAREAAAAANARAAEATTKAAEAINTTAEVKTTEASLNATVSDPKASNESLTTVVAAQQAEAKKASEEGPRRSTTRASASLPEASSRQKLCFAIARTHPTSILRSPAFRLTEAT